jgi:hypothetical protein
VARDVQSSALVYCCAHEERSSVVTETKKDMLPRLAIRRFDVFAEFTRQDRLQKGEPEDEAKGYGIWLAKVVASRQYGSKADSYDKPGAHKAGSGLGERQKFRSVGDELQTDRVFDHDIIDRMGEEFYRQVFVPAIEEARAKGDKYEDIRDSIRKSWKPPKSKK